MKRKFQGLVIVILAGVIAAGCTIKGEAEMQKTVIINDDVQLESSLTDSTLRVTHKATIPVTEKADYTGFHGDQIYYNEKGSTHSLNIHTQKAEVLTDHPFYSISEDGNRALSFVDDKIYVIDFASKEKKVIGKGDKDHYYFADGAGKEIIYVDTNEGIQIEVLDIEKGKTKKWDLRDTFKLDNFALNTIQRDKDGIYIVADSVKDEFGLYHLKNDDSIEVISDLPKVDRSMDTYQFVDVETIIFNDTYDGKTGIYLMNVKTKVVTQLVAGGEDEEGVWVPFYKLSPDKSKILFDTPVQVEDGYKTNVYMAELKDGQVSNTLRIMENADLYTVISMSGYWSADSKTAYISTTKPGGETIDAIEVFQLQ